MSNNDLNSNDIPNSYQEKLSKDYILSVYRILSKRETVTVEQIMEMDSLIDLPASERASEFKSLLVKITEESKKSKNEEVDL